MANLMTLALVATLLSPGLARAESWVIPEGWARQATVIYLSGFDPVPPDASQWVHDFDWPAGASSPMFALTEMRDGRGTAENVNDAGLVVTPLGFYRPGTTNVLRVKVSRLTLPVEGEAAYVEYELRLWYALPQLPPTLPPHGQICKVRKRDGTVKCRPTEDD